MTPQNSIKKVNSIAVVIAYSVVASFAVYVAIVEFFHFQHQPFTGFGVKSNYYSIRYIFYVLAAADVLIIRLLRGLLLKKSSQDDSEALTSKLLRASIITSFLCELPAILGLALFFLYGISRDFYILLFISLFLMVMFFPRLSHWQTWLEQRGDSTCTTCIKLGE